MNSIFLNLDKPIVIVEYPTGITYYGQVGGGVCWHPEVEGFLLPVPSRFMDLRGKSCETNCGDLGLCAETVAVLLSVWPEQEYYNEGYTIHLDMDRISEGTEAWFPVIVKQSWDKELVWLDGLKGWLLMDDNCD